LSSISIPTCYKQAIGHECWQQAMEAELQALSQIILGTLYLVLHMLSPLVVSGSIL
jgi:hypothetical protein